jgi:hypothetical protein
MILRLYFILPHVPPGIPGFIRKRLDRTVLHHLRHRHRRVFGPAWKVHENAIVPADGDAGDLMFERRDFLQCGLFLCKRDTTRSKTGRDNNRECGDA